MLIYEPRRKIYRKKISTVRQCEFCNQKNIKEQECKNLRSDFWRVLVNKYPYMDGNVMLIPKRHIKHIEELNEQEWQDFKVVLEKTKKILSRLFGTDDFNVGINIGKMAGSSIEHMHWQILPRKSKVANATNIFADIQILTVLPKELKKMIEGREK